MSILRGLCFVVAVAWAVPGLPADDKKEAKSLSGTWAKKDGDILLEFTGKDGLKFHPHGDKQTLIIICEYAVDKDGIVKAKVTDYDANADQKAHLKQVVPVGFEFKFKYTVTKETAKLDDVTGEKTEMIKSMLEGDYEVKK